MVKYVGIRNDRVIAVADSPFESKGMKVVESSADDPMGIVNVGPRPKKDLKEMKVAFVGNWKMVCGISTYSEKLWPEVAKHFGSFRLFIEKNDSPTTPLTLFGKTEIPSSDVVQCWTRGGEISDLVTSIHEFAPDIVFIQHEYGLWSNAGRWLSLMNQLAKYKVFVTMHSIFYHRDKTVVEASIPNMIVHLDGAKKVLESHKKVSGAVHVIPHGCDPYLPEKLWNIYRTPRTFMQAGFGFHYKGWETSLKATALLQKKYPDVFFTGVFSESPFCLKEHEIYFQDLMQLVEGLGIHNNVGMVRGFQSDEVLDSFFRTNQVAVFPYVSTEKHEVFGASGAARLAMSKGIPVVTSHVNHFSDLPTIKISDEVELAEILERLFEDWKFKRKHMNIQKAYIQDNSWSKVAEAYVKLFCGKVV